MKSLKQFLFEQYSKQDNSAQLVLQKIIDMVDDGHVDYSDDKININVGRLIKNKNFYNFLLIIRKSNTANIRLGTDNSDNYVIVIDTKTLPKREKIDSFLSHARYFDKIVNGIKAYLSNHYAESDADEETSYEKRKSSNSRESFEENYSKIKDNINGLIEEYKKSKQSLERELEETGSPSKKEMINQAIKKLRDDILGSNAKEFINKMIKDNEFINHLDKEWKNKLTSRLEDYYEHLGTI